MTHKPRPLVLVVDDVPSNIDLLVEALSPHVDVTAACDGESAIAMARAMAPDLIIMDVVMPGVDGFQALARLRKFPETESIPLIFVTSLDDVAAQVRGLEAGAVDYLVKPVHPLLVEKRALLHIELRRHHLELEATVRARTRELRATLRVAVETLGALAEHRDSDTGAHVVRTAHYVRELALRLRERGTPGSEELTDALIEDLFVAVPLHDIGKVGIPDHILLKPGKLTPEEFEIMKGHTTLGWQVLDRASRRMPDAAVLRLAADVAWAHHERWDGKGYPRQLATTAIPLPARLMTVADVYDALTTVRVYKPAMPHAEAVAYILEQSGGQFDPDVVLAFSEIQHEFLNISRRLAAGQTGGIAVTPERPQWPNQAPPLPTRMPRTMPLNVTATARSIA